MIVFRRVNFSDMADRYYIKKVLYSKFAEAKTTHSPKRDDGSVTIQKIPTSEGARKERKRKLEAGIADGEIRPMVSFFKCNLSKILRKGCEFCSQT